MYNPIIILKSCAFYQNKKVALFKLFNYFKIYSYTLKYENISLLAFCGKHYFINLIIETLL